MNRDDIIRMAREAHRDLVTIDYPGHAGQLDPWTLRLLERFAELVAAAEREACAKVCEDQIKSYCSPQYTINPLEGYREQFASQQCANAIRARGEK